MQEHEFKNKKSSTIAVYKNAAKERKPKSTGIESKNLNED